MVALLGTRDELLRLVEDAFSSAIHVRGNEITVTGRPDEAERVAQLFEELILLLGQGQPLDKSAVGQTIRMVKSESDERPSSVLSQTALSHRGRTIRPKTLGQKRYLDTIDDHTVTFSIGPAGTGKTYLAMAAAVQDLRDREVNRLVITRPAVEAGESLGYLPGTLQEKIDPYLRPLWDALHDMMDADELVAHVDRGTIEVAPLGYMRGRAQPLSTPVATPTGFRPIGELEVGDLVVGSDGRPTPVLGVFPQGRKPVYRVSTQDGASTLCCGEHLWAVQTRHDRYRGKPPRVLETRQMIGRLRAAHYHRYELPLVAAVQYVEREVPMDPYALGLLLGDGHTAGLTGGAPRPGSGTDHGSVQHGGGGRGVLVEDRVTDEMPPTDPATRCVPAAYLVNSVRVRHALLQGLLDSGGGKVTQRGTTSRIGFATSSEPLRHGVTELVRSLGGVAYPRLRDPHVLDIRLPAPLEPFRLVRKAEIYGRTGGGRPMRFIDSIEPESEQETVCIQVAAADSLYVTEDFLVTHNTLNNSFIVLDEAQNTTAEQMKMFLTRIGFGSRAVVTGDITQIDLPSGRHSGLRVVRDILEDIEGIGFCYLGAADVVRHPIVQRIVEAYERHTAETERAKRRRSGSDRGR